MRMIIACLGCYCASLVSILFVFFFSSRRRHTRLQGDWSSDVCSSDLFSPYGPDTQYAFGHIGFTNVLTWADPERQETAALLTSGKPLVYPELYYLWDMARQIGLARPKAGALARPASAALAARGSVSERRP